MTPLTGKTQSFSVPFPPKELSSNARLHWAKVNKVKKAYQRAVWAALLEQKVRKMTDEKISIEMTFYPPVQRTHDDDNLAGQRMKAARDQIAKHIGVDDSVFTMARPVILAPEPPHGRVQIVLRPSLVEVPITGTING